MKFIFVILILLLCIAKFAFMQYVFTLLIILGILVDVIDFVNRLKAWIGRKDVPSAIPILGFLFTASGLLGLAIRMTITWKLFVFLLPVALFVHLSFQMLFPLLLTILRNIYHKRKLFDFNPLPEIKKRNGT
jgi:hypothetical protein